MARPMLSLNFFTSKFESNIDAEEPGPSWVPATYQRGSRPPRRARQPLRRYDKGGRDRQFSNRPPPEYARDTEDTDRRCPHPSPTSSLDGSDAATENSGVHIAELPNIECRPHPRSASAHLQMSESSGDAMVSKPSSRSSRSKKRALESNRKKFGTTHTAPCREQAHIIADKTYQAILNDSCKKPWGQMCRACMVARHREACFWGWNDDLNTRLEELEEDFQSSLISAVG